MLILNADTYTNQITVRKGIDGFENTSNNFDDEYL